MRYKTKDSIRSEQQDKSKIEPANYKKLSLTDMLNNIIPDLEKKTKEIENLHKLLEIEACLERVRIQAMEMKKPDDLLEVCKTMFGELKSLGFTELRNTMIDVHNDENESFLNYDYSDVLGKSITQLSYNIHPLIEKQTIQIKSSNDAFAETVFTGKELEAWKEFRRKSGEKDDPRINDITSLYYYFYSIETGSIGISTFAPATEENLELLKRFRNVFNLSYRRYMDIVLAESQVREAVKQASLDRVRAEIASMRTAEDLKQITPIIWRELTALDVPFIRCGIFIINEPDKTVQVYLTTPEGKSLGSFKSFC